MGKYSLIVVSGFIITFGLIQANVNRANERFADNLVASYSQDVARHIASSGARIAVRKLVEDFNYRAGWSGRSMFGGTSAASLVDRNTDTSLTLSQVRVTSIGAYGGATDTAVVVWRKASFSEFAYFTNVEPVIYFTTGDSLKGPVHTNGTLHISGNPVFTGKVTSPNPWVGSGSPKFLGGADFSHGTISLPTDVTPVKTAAQTGGLVFTPALGKSLWLEFQADGTVRHVILNDGTAPSGGTTWTTVALSTFNGVIHSTRNIRVKGTVNGKVTVASDKNIYIQDDILYAADPRVGASDDFLGLVSGLDAIVADNTANQTNCEIHASILALGKFRVENYNTGSPRGTLTVLGGIVQETRGAVGTLSGGSLATGYYKNYQYDSRLLNEAPPSFPTTGENTAGNPYAPGRVVTWYQ